MSLPIALQLFTVRDPLKEDFEGTLANIAEIGYRFVEFAGFHGRSVEQVRETCRRLGLQGCAAHHGITEFEVSVEGLVQTATTLGYDCIVLPFLPKEWRTAEGYRKLAAVLRQAGKEAAQKGIQVLYHNHDFEFEPIDGQVTGMEILATELEGARVGFELDTCWVQLAGQDPVKWLRDLAGRVPIIHIKDAPDPGSAGGRRFTEVGTGSINLPGVLKAAPEAGVRYLVVEQDADWKGTPLDSARTSYVNLVTMLQRTGTAPC